jgi:hypothetical protein
MPGTRRTRSLACNLKKHASKSLQVRRRARHSLRNGLRLMARSPRCPGFDSHRRLELVAQDLIPASGDQDHTLSPSASALLVRQLKSVHRIPHSTFRDDWP